MADVLVGVGIFLIAVVVLSLVAFFLVRGGGDSVIESIGSSDEADREAKARSYGIDHLGPPS